MRPVIGIAHAAFAEGRRWGLERLVGQLKEQGVEPYVQVSETPEHAQVWARRLWAWAATQNAPAILLNDDVTVSPDLVSRVDEMTDVLPDELISLHCQLPAAKSLAEAGVTWLRSYWTSGPGYVLPPGVPAKLEDWISHTPSTILGKWNEDGYCNMFSFSRRRPQFHCLPALVQHDCDIPSTLGYDKHTLRVATVDWADPLFASGLPQVRLDGPAPFVDNPWMTVTTLIALEALRDMPGVPLPSAGLCFMCKERPPKFNSASTGAGVCGSCVSACVAASMGAGQPVLKAAPL
jgi:hypothetical protein